MDNTPELNTLRYETPDLETIRPYLDGPLAIGELYDAAADGTHSLGVPLDRQRRHVAHIAAAGTGKTVTAQLAVCSNMQATDGLDIVIDPKGGFADGFLPMAYHETGSLESVTVITAATEMLRVPLWDLRPFQNAPVEIGRSRLIEIVVDAGMEVLKSAAASSESFENASQSLELIRTLLTASFRAGADAVSLTDLLERLSEVESQTLSLSVPDPVFDSYLTDTTGGDRRTRRTIVGGARRRLSPLIRDRLFATAFGSVPDEYTHQFDFVDALDRDEVVIIDTAGLGPNQREQIIRLITARAFAAGRLRQLDSTTNKYPLANIYLDEAHVLGDSNVLLDLLSEGRAFGISLYLMSQKLGQFGTEAQAHIATNVGTVLTAQADAAMAQAIGRGPFGKREAEHLIGRIPAGEWLVRLRPHRGHSVPTPFLINAGDLPMSHPLHPEYESQPQAERDACREAITRCRERSRALDTVVTTEATDHSGDDYEEIKRGLDHTLWLPNVELPTGVSYDVHSDKIRCDSCDEEFLPSFSKLCVALRHCRSDGDLTDCELPITDIGLTSVTPKKVELCALSIAEVMFLRLLERARRRAIDSRAWDIRTESMYPLRKAVGLAGSDPKERLVEAGYITIQKELPGEYYNLTKKSRTLLRQLRDGADPPEPKRGDPAESVLHIKGIERAVTALEELLDDPTTPIDRVERYWNPPDSADRIDAVGLDATGEPRVCVEVERETNDLSTGVLEDADAMAACDPDATVWVVPTRSLGHAVIDHLVNPSMGQPRISLDPTDILSNSTSLSRYDLDSSACSRVVTYGTIDTEVFRTALATE